MGYARTTHLQRYVKCSYCWIAAYAFLIVRHAITFLPLVAFVFFVLLISRLFGLFSLWFWLLLLSFLWVAMQYDVSSIEHTLTQRHTWTLSRHSRQCVQCSLIDLATTANRHQMNIEIKSILLSFFSFLMKSRRVSLTPTRVSVHELYN